MTNIMVGATPLLIDLPKRDGYVGRHRRELTRTERGARLHRVFGDPFASPEAFGARVTVAVFLLGSVGSAAFGVIL